ncbi:hypothetical protein ACFSLT_18885 [Novosphingobium resinovorum]|uniref:hypothetical protein n=1 Tax=Novosphingobium resinovorum TaxID=158500 RepID=UPI00361FBEE8
MTLISLISNDPSRFDPLSLDQLQATADYEGMARVVGLPDLHAGNGIAVGRPSGHRIASGPISWAATSAAA